MRFWYVPGHRHTQCCLGPLDRQPYMCALTSALTHTCALTWFSHVFAHSCMLLYMHSHWCALLWVLSYVCSVLHLFFYVLCVPSQIVCSHEFVHILCSLTCVRISYIYKYRYCIYVLSWVCFRICVRSCPCSRMRVLECGNDLLTLVFFYSALFGVSCRMFLHN